MLNVFIIKQTSKNVVDKFGMKCLFNFDVIKNKISILFFNLNSCKNYATKCAIFFDFVWFVWFEPFKVIVFLGV